MGNITSRQNVGVEEVDIVSNHAYKYPPRSGNYFGSHFIMGGERFDTPQPEAYLFGENVDLNFLGSRPTPFPYPPPQANEPTKTLKNLVNIRKESVRFVKAPESVLQEKFPNEMLKDNKFNIEFTFDSDVKCSITLYYFCTEEITNTGLVYTCKDPSLVSETYYYKRGSNQQFSQTSHIFDPSNYSEEELSYDLEKEIIPIAIHCIAEEGIDGETRQSHTTIAVVDRHSDGTYVLRALKQKLYVDGLCYLLQEIYGIENKNNENLKAMGDEEAEDNGSECVICMCDVRDTLILPCRHLCLCNSCADSLRYQANNCPICRAPFRALLQIRALQKSSNSASNPTLNNEGNCDQIPAGYEAVSLIEALNGPCMIRQVPCLNMAETPNSESAVQAAEMLNRSNNSEEGKKSLSESGSLSRMNLATCSTPEFRMSVLFSREEGSKSSPVLRHSSSKLKADQEDYLNEEISAKEQDQNAEVDSDAEKFSPLLSTKNDPADESNAVEIESSEKEKKLMMSASGDRGDDSDYYTPEDPAPTILSPLYESDKDQPVPSSVESTPGRWIPARDLTMAVSLPGTPLSTSSHLSTRSSGDSYSSTSSTRHLLAHNLAAKQEKVSSGHQI
ncbi:UNVERIFIED_CONTAM: hypothetical protein PYX00_005192 [Menopon gallinae]|uniref:RING-type E3 ubiquitin transferase n=1 Tax=Menopon gallinae TaxID=328185 RepID=A0AAW2HR41_9NEOP